MVLLLLRNQWGATAPLSGFTQPNSRQPSASALTSYVDKTLREGMNGSRWLRPWTSDGGLQHPNAAPGNTVQPN
jgi:hypothetical protein